MNTICTEYENSATTFTHLPDFSEFVRPRTFSELMLSEKTINLLQKAFDNTNPPNMLFYGSPGSGKSSCANIFAKETSSLVRRFNCADKKTKNSLKCDFVSLVHAPSLFHRQKLFVFEEADSLSPSIQLDLRNLIESSVHNSRFIFTCNDRSIIDPAIRSRLIEICFDAPFARRDELLLKLTDTVMSRLSELKLSVSRDDVFEIARTHYPDYRKIAKLVEFTLM